MSPARFDGTGADSTPPDDTRPDAGVPDDPPGAPPLLPPLSGPALSVLAALPPDRPVDSADLGPRSGAPADVVAVGLGELVRSRLARVRQSRSGALMVSATRHAAAVLRAGREHRHPSGRAGASPGDGAPAEVTTLSADGLHRVRGQCLSRVRQRLLVVDATADPRAADGGHDVSPETAGVLGQLGEPLRRGVRVDVVLATRTAASPGVRREIEDLEGAGAEVRLTDDLIGSFAVFDDAMVITRHPQRRPGRDDGGLAVREPALVDAYRVLGSRVHRTGLPLADVTGVARLLDDPDPLELRVLELMRSGLTDRSCAKRLQVTDRTFRRYVTGLLDHLGASSRVDAGIKAAERGWL